LPLEAKVPEFTDAVTRKLLLATLLPDTSRTSTTGCVANVEPLAEFEALVVIASWLAVPWFTVMVSEVEMLLGDAIV